MPNREEFELDPVTLHNSAILNQDKDINNSITKLLFLINAPPYPKETVGNLFYYLFIIYCCLFIYYFRLILLCNSGDYSRASEILQLEKQATGQITGAGLCYLFNKRKTKYFIGGTVNVSIGGTPISLQSGGAGGSLSTWGRIGGVPGTAALRGNIPLKTGMAPQGPGKERLIDAWLRDFVEATLIQQTSGMEAYRAFQVLSEKQLADVKKATKAVQELRQSSSTPEQANYLMKQQEDAVGRYIPTVMSMAKIFWDLKKYTQTAKVLQSCKDV
jgi:hypothetical protein